MARTSDSPRQKALRDFLVEKRKEAGLRQVDLAKRLKRRQDYVSYVETGQKLVEVVELMEWAEAIGFDPRDAIAARVGFRISERQARRFASLHCEPVAQCRSNPVSGRSLQKTGVWRPLPNCKSAPLFGGPLIERKKFSENRNGWLATQC